MGGDGLREGWKMTRAQALRSSKRIIGKLPRVKDKDGKEWVRVGKRWFEKEWMIENMTMMMLMGKM